MARRATRRPPATIRPHADCVPVTLDPTTLAAIAEQIDVVDVAAGEVLLSQGDVADAMYVVLAGSLAVAVQASGSVAQPHHVAARGAPARVRGSGHTVQHLHPRGMPPVPADGQLLVDGGLLDNLPVATMRGLNPTGPVIASDVVPPVGPSAKGDWGPAVSGWKVLASYLPGRPSLRIPSIANKLLRSTIVASNRSRDDVVRNELADCYSIWTCGGRAFRCSDSKVAEAARVGLEGSVDRLSAWWCRENSRR